jgi:hypothetical protein
MEQFCAIKHGRKIMRELSFDEIDVVSGGGYVGYEFCVAAFSGLGALAFSGFGPAGAFLGGLAGLAYGQKFCPLDGSYQADYGSK